MNTSIRVRLNLAMCLFALSTVFPVHASDRQIDEDMFAAKLKSEAKEKARERGALSIVISHGKITADPNNDIESPKEFVEGLRKWLRQGDITLLDYYAPDSLMQENHMALTISNGYTSRGPLSPQRARDEMADIVKEFYHYRKLFKG